MASQPPVTSASAPPRLGRLRGLDGLRAIAVAAVLAYHLDLGVAPGGFLGVEVFFVISGFLITGLLAAEWRETGSISLPRFWARRARRLLPALFALLIGTLGAAAVAFPAELARLREDALAAVAYVTNWYLVLGQQPYFETVGRPSPLLHLWSLAIEEQFYLAWPVLLGIALLAVGRRGAIALVGVGIVASATGSALLYVPQTDPSRVYYGTDTRAAGLLAGALLALVLLPRLGRLRAAPSRGRRLLAGAAGVLALAAVVTAFALVDETQAPLYPAGLLAVDAATVVLIASVVSPAGGFLGVLLESAPVRWLGTRSYAVYLWHWPIVVFTRPGLDLPLDGPANVVFRLAATGLLAEASYRLVERPVRSGALGRAWLGLRAQRPRRLVAVRPAMLVAGAGLVTMLLTDVVTASPPPPPPEVPVAALDGLVTPPPETADDAIVPRVTPTGHDDEEASSSPGASSGPARAPSADRVSRLRPVPVAQPVLGIGESVLIAAAPSLARVLGPLDVDAAVGRQVADDVAAIQRHASQGRLAGTVIVNIGNNGPIYSRDLDEAMDALRDVPTVVWVNVSVPRQWEPHNNRLIADYAARHPNVRLVDWHAASSGHPELFAPDDVHPNRDGARLMASLVASALAP
jgi:peptidoglycan/LPS O-acetylase OafA/YrhL